MPGNFYRGGGGGGDRGGGRKRLPSVLRGGPAAKSMRFAGSNPYRGRGRGSPIRGGGRGSIPGRGVNFSRGRGGGFHGNRRDDLPPPHRRERRSPSGPQQSSASNERRQMGDYQSSSQYSSEPSSSHHHHNEEQSGRRENYDQYYNRSNRDQFSPNATRYDSNYYRGSRERERPHQRSGSNEDRRRRRSISRTPPPRDRDRESRHIDERSNTRPIDERSNSRPVDERSNSRPIEDRSSQQRQRDPASSSRGYDTNSSNKASTEGNNDTGGVRDADIPSSLPRPAGSALPRAPLPPPPASARPTVRTPSPSSSSRSSQHRRSNERSMDDANTSPADVGKSSSRKEYQHHQDSYKMRGGGYSRGGRGRGGGGPHRESALNRLGPKMKVTQRLGGVVRGGHHHQHHSPYGSSGKNGSGEDSTMQITIRSDHSSSREVNDDSIVKSDAENVAGEKKKFMKLQCPHCNVKTVTFSYYLKHLKSETHLKALNKLTPKLRMALGRMRVKQRREQREIEEKLAADGKDVDEEGNKLRSLYCKTCKLMFHQSLEEHNQSEMHKAISKFLFPNCTVCVTQFFSPIAYEKHIASLIHIKKKASLSENRTRDEDDDEDESDHENGNDLPEFSEGDFVTLDEVGEDEDDNEINDNNEDISDTEENYNDDFNESKSHRTADSEDEEEDRKEDSHKTADDDREDGDDRDGRNVNRESEENNDNESATDSPDKAKSEDKVVVEPKKRKVITPIKMEPEKPKKPTTPIKFESKVAMKSELTENSIYIDPSKPVGETYVRKVEMFYCDLCHKYLPRASSKETSTPESSVAVHCMTPFHQSAFAKKRQEEIEKEEKALCDLVNHEVEDLEEEDTLIISTKMEDDEDQLDYEEEGDSSIISG